MSTNPYASYGNPQGPAGDFLAPEPTRVSVLAIVAFILSLLCIPPTGALAVVLGGTAVLFIGNSAGRLRGMGLAIAGIIIGLITTLIWIVLLIGARQAIGVFSNLAAPADKAILQIQQGDLKAARLHFSPASDQAMTDEMMRRFAESYTAELGAYKGAVASDPMSWISAIMRHQTTMNSLGGAGRSGDEFPFVGTFDKSEAVVLMQFQPPTTASGPGGVPTPVIENISIWTGPGKSIWLIDEDKLPRRKRSGGAGGAGTPAIDAAPGAVDGAADPKPVGSGDEPKMP